ncbi:lipoprotein insertase outer membrane protein LolB [Luteimonas sp. A611]
MTHLRIHAAAVIAALLLSACASQPLRTPVPVDPQQARQSAAHRAAIADWNLSGRVAISGGRQGGSGRIDWTQRGDRYDITLSAPVTRQGWRLSGDAASALLEGIEGGPRESADVEDLLRAATGWEVPVRAMVDWARAVVAPEAAYGPAQVSHGAGNLPALIGQAGWQVEYRDWYEAGPGQPALPRRIEATRDDARVRLIVDSWTLVPGAVPPPGDAGTDSPDQALARTLQTLRLDDAGADMRERAAAGDLRPVAVCGFACLAPGFGPEGAAVAQGVEMRIIDGSGDAIIGDRHMALKLQAQAYAETYNRALAAWLRARADAGDAASAD